jgi:sugar/nucleoside kinase (ribokinase family)
MQAARRLGMSTHIDINWDPLWSVPGEGETAVQRRSWVKSTLPHVDFVHANEPELLRFSGARTTDEGINFVFESGAKTIVLHRGAKGSAVATVAGQWIEAPSLPVDNPTCETGTGDVFSAAFLLHAQLPIAERLARCNAIAADYLRGDLQVFGRL